jgi:hypothetical protein
MKTSNCMTRLSKLSVLGKVLTCFAVSTLLSIAYAQDDADGITFDGLVRIEDSQVAMAYINPDADFSVFQRVAILDPYVSFVSNWQRDQNRSRSRNVRTSDMERIQADVASLFKDVFTEVLEADDGYEVVDGANEDVLLLRPAIIDLDVSAPDTRSAGRSRTFTATAGAATIYIELFDSLSGQIIGRAADRQNARRAGGSVSWSNSVTNTQEARRMMRRWAEQLRSFLDEHYTPND